MTSATEEDTLKRLARAWGLPAERTRIAVQVGDPTDTLLDIVAERECTLIILARHGRDALARGRFGGIGDRLARRAPTPTLVVRPDHVAVSPGIAATVNRLVVPLDGSPRAEQALPVARALARQLEVPIQLVRVVPPPDLPDVLAVGSDAASHYLAAVGDLALRGVETVIDVRTGKVVPRLLEVVEPVDLVVLTRRGRGGSRRWLPGGVADKLLRHTSAPVCLVPSAAS